MWLRERLVLSFFFFFCVSSSSNLALSVEGCPYKYVSLEKKKKEINRETFRRG